MRTLTMHVTSPAPTEVWKSIFDADPEAVPYQHPNWFASICESGNYKDVSRLYETGDGRQFVLPLVQRRGLPACLSIAASPPSAWGMGGLVGSQNVHYEEMLAVFDDLTHLPYLRVSIRPNPRLAALWAAAAPKSVLSIPRRAHVLDLEGGFERVWKERFEKKTRTAVRKAERLGVVVESATGDRLLPVFYKLLQRSFNRWSRQQNEPPFLTRLRGQWRDPYEKFERIARHMGSACRIWVAWVDEKPAAASLVLQHGNVNDSRGAMDKEVASTSRCNELLQKCSIEEACRAGCHYYHLGESGNSASLSHYKERFGAVPYEYAEYVFERIPITSIDRMMRTIVKKLIGFKDV